ncbi:MAG: DUF3382 domain-containing protein, partial [Rhodomicrobium sp.]
MADVAERPVAKTAAGAAEAQGAADAARDAGITFLLALALFGSIVGLRTDSANGGLEITTHFAKAAGLAAAVAALRFLLDILVWRPLDAGRTLAFLKQFAARAKLPAIVASLAAGLLLYAVGGLRTELIELASGQSWLAGTLIDLVTFVCIAAFIVVFAMLAVRGLRLFFALFAP